MIFRKSERKRFPAILGLTVGALAVVGAMSIKKRGKEMMNSVSSKMKNVLHKKDNECMMTEMSCE